MKKEPTMPTSRKPLSDAEFLAALTPLIPKVETERQVRELTRPAPPEAYPTSMEAILKQERERRIA